MNFEDLTKKKQQLIATMRAAQTKKAIFCTSDIEMQKEADKLITEGKIIELENPGGLDRAFTFTEAGKNLNTFKI